MFVCVASKENGIRTGAVLVFEESWWNLSKITPVLGRDPWRLLWADREEFRILLHLFASKKDKFRRLQHLWRWALQVCLWTCRILPVEPVSDSNPAKSAPRKEDDEFAALLSRSWRGWWAQMDAQKGKKWGGATPEGWCPSCRRHLAGFPRCAGIF